MPIVHSRVPTNLFVSTVSPSVESPMSASVSLRLEQMVQAFVVETDNDRTVLEIGENRYQVPGKSALRVGEKLTLQVQQIEPQLEFRVLNNPVNNRLAQTLPSLAQPFDWGELVTHLQSLVAEGRLPDSVVAVLTQLEDLLVSPAESVQLKEKLGEIVAQLKQLIAPEGELLIASPSISSPSVSPFVQNPLLSAEAELFQAIAALVKNLQSQLSSSSPNSPVEPAKVVSTEIKNLLNALSTERDVQQLKSMVAPALDRIRHSVNLPPRLVADIQRILAEVNTQNSQVVTASLAGKISLGGAGTTPPAMVYGNAEWQEIAAEIKDLLGQMAQLQKQGTPISPDLLGRLEGLQLRFLAAEGLERGMPGAEIVLAQIHQLISQPSTTLSGEKLGILSQLFGLSFETELLDGKKKAALASLKSCLLELQQDGDDVKDPLRRLELFQLCKAKLAENHVQFLPLPFSELEEGYLLAEKQGHPDDTGGEDPSLQMSLSLRLSALGNVRIDILYEDDGLYLRLAGDGRQKTDYLKSCQGELEEALQAVKLKGVSFSADAGLPARQLQERLLPESSNIFDARM